MKTKEQIMFDITMPISSVDDLSESDRLKLKDYNRQDEESSSTKFEKIIPISEEEEILIIEIDDKTGTLERLDIEYGEGLLSMNSQLNLHHHYGTYNMSLPLIHLMYILLR